MEKTAPVSLRTAGAADAHILRKVLMDAAFRPGQARPLMEVALADPAIGHYIAGWPLPGDHGVVAEAAHGGGVVGAAWFRFFRVDDPGYGFVDVATPELSIAVRDGWRHRGIGRLLLSRLLVDAAGLGVSHLSLSVSLANQNALRLYRSVGFEQVGPGDDDGGSVTMGASTDR